MLTGSVSSEESTYYDFPKSAPASVFWSEHQSEKELAAEETSFSESLVVPE